MDGIVTSVLNSVLSQYVKTFNKDEVDLSVWKGEAKLTNVELKPDALDFLNLPIAIRVGFAGRIFLQVDWKHLNSKPARIELEDLRIVCGPKSKFEMTSEMEKEQEEQEQNAKKQLLETWESLTLVPQEDTKAKPDAGYTQRVLEKVIDNIHVMVKKVHVRYEDNVKNRNMAFGIAIGSLAAVTTNDQWEPEFLAQSKQFVRKRVTMDGFCVYLNTKSIISERDFLSTYFNASLDTIFDGNESRQYIVRPTGLELKVIMNKDIEKDNFTIPQIKIVGKMREISLNLGQDQYTDLMSIVSNITIASSYGKYLSYKPKKSSIEKEPKKYWKWAIGCIVRDEKEKRNLSWRKFAIFGVDRNKYIALYLKRLNCEWEKEMSAEDIEALEAIEKKYDYNDILYFRKCAVAQLRVQSKNKPVLLRSKMPKESSNVFSGWFGKKKKKKEDNKPIPLTQHQRNYLYFQIGAALDNSINYDTFSRDSADTTIAELLNVGDDDDKEDEEEEEEDDGRRKEIDPSKLPKDFEQIQFAFELSGASLALLDIMEEKDKVPANIMGITFDGISMNIAVRPLGSLMITMGLRTMELVDYYKSDNMITRSMIQRTDVLELQKRNKSVNMKELTPLFNIEFELNPLDKSADFRIFLRSQPITVDLHIPVFLRLGPFFVQERQVDMHAFERAALLQLEALQNASRAALDDAVAFHKTMALDVEFYGPTIMLREDPSNEKSTKLVVDLGKFAIKSALKPRKKRKTDGNEDGKEQDEDEDDETKELMEKLKALKEQAAESGGTMAVNDDALSTYYDCFNVSLKDIKIYLNRDIPRNHILTPLNMDSKLYRSIFPSDPKLPTIVLKAEIPKVSTKLASSDIRRMYFMMENLIVDSYHEMTDQDEFFKQRAAVMAKEEKDDDDGSEDTTDSSISRSAKKLAEERAKGEEELQEEAEDEYFDEKTKLELLQKVNLLLSVQIGDVQFSLVNDDNFDKTGQSTPIIIANIGGTYVYLQQRKWDMTMEAGLAEILIEDHVCDASQLKERPYVMRTGHVNPKLLKKQQTVFALDNLGDEQTKKKTEFFKLNLNMVDAKSPKYERLDMVVEMRAGDVIFYLRPETIYGLTEVLIKNVFPSAEKGQRRQSLSAQSGIDIMGEAQDKIKRERERKERMKQEKEQQKQDALSMIEKRSQKRKDIIKIKLDITYSSVQLYICAKQFNICKSSIEGFKLNLIVYPYSMDMELTLGNILLTDETYIADLTKYPNYPYKAIMGHVDTQNKELKQPPLEPVQSLTPVPMDSDNARDPLVSLVLNIYNEVEVEYPGYGIKIDIGLKGMRLTFLKRFVDEVLSWLMNSALLKIPQLITDQLAQSQLVTGHEELKDVKQEDLGIISEDAEVDENDIKEDIKEEEPAMLPQMNIVVENMELLVPKSSVNNDYIKGNLGRLMVYNDVLNKEDNTKIIVQVSNTTIATRFGTDKLRETVPLFTQPAIKVVLGKEFTDINIEFNQISMQLAKKQYEFLMELLSGNLAEEAVVATRVYPQRQSSAEDLISDEQKERARDAAIEATKEQLKKDMKITLNINQFSAHLLKGYGLEFDPISLEGKDSLVGYGIDGLALNVVIGQQITVELTMDNMGLKDVSYDTIQNGVQEVYREIIAFNSNFEISDKSREDTKAMTSINESQASYPFQVIVGVDQESNQVSVDVKMIGLQFTFGSVLWTLLQFVNINPAKKEKLPPVPEDLNNFQLSLLRAGNVSQVALVDDIKHPQALQQQIIEDDEKSMLDLKEEEEEEKQEEDVPLSLKVDVQIRDTMVKLIRFPKKERSPALVLQLDIITTVKMDKTTPLFVDAQIARVQAYQATISVVQKQLSITVRDGVPKIIEPFDINATIQQYNSAFDRLTDRKSDAKGMKGNVVMVPMVMRFGYSDFDILMSSLNAITPPALEDEADQEEEKKYDVGADTESEASFSSQEDEPSAKQLQMHKQMELQKKAHEEIQDLGELEFSVEVGRISLVLVNDKNRRSEIPIAKFVINNVGAELYSYKQRMAIAAQFALHGDYYNNEIAEWEPMIEKWSAKASVVKNIDCAYIQFLPDNVFNVSFTYSMVQSAIAAVEVLSGAADDEKKAAILYQDDDEEDDVSKSHSRRMSDDDVFNMAKHAKSHRLNNQTEFDLVVTEWQSDELKDNDKAKIEEILKSLKKSVTKTLKVGSMLSTDFNTYPIQIERRFKRKVGIEVRLTDEYEPFVLLDTNQIRERTYYVKNKKDDANSLILQATHALIGGAKEICIHSPIQFVNKTELNLALFNKQLNVEKHSTAYCPVLGFMKSLTFDCVPTTNEDNKPQSFKVVEELPLSPYTDDASYPIHSKREDGITYSMMLHTKRIKTGERILFSIDSTVQVENLLVSDISITFIQNDKRDQLTIKSGETKNAYSAYKSRIDSLEMKDKGLISKEKSQRLIEETVQRADKRWNKSSSFLSEEKQQEVGDKDRVRFDFMDPSNNTRLSVIAELTQTEVRGAVTLTFYVPYWIYDLTDLKLIPSEDKTTKNAVAGRSVEVYKDKKEAEVEPQMFNFHTDSGKSKISVCSTSYDAFSRSFPPDAVGSTGRINELYGKHEKRQDKLKYEYEVGVDINVILGPFRGLVKSIILMPRIILKNDLKCALLVRQIKSDVVPEKYCQIFRVEKGTTKPFYWVIPKHDTEYKRRYIQFKKDIEQWQWSSYIPVNETSDWTMTTRHKNANIDPQLMKVNITSSGAAMYVQFKKADYQYPPYRIENRTLATHFRFCQQHINLWRIVEPLKNEAYGWDDPQREDKHIIINIIATSETYKYSIDESAESAVLKYKQNHSVFQLHVGVQMFGPTKVLIISDFRIPRQEDASMLKLKNPVNLSKIFRDEKLVVQQRLKHLDLQIDELDKKINQYSKQRKLSQSTSIIKPKLIVQVVEARNLVQTGVFSGQADPYVEVALHSKESFKRKLKPKHYKKTRVMKNTRNPVWNTEFVFDGVADDFYALGLDVKDHGLVTDTFMGGATIKLTGLLQHAGKTMDQWVRLKGTQQTKRLTKNGDIHLKITFAKSEIAAIDHDVTRCIQQKAIYRKVQMRVLEEIRKRQEMDPDLLPKQNRHRIAVKLDQNLYGTCFDQRKHELFFIIRCGNEARRVGFNDNLFDDDNDKFDILEDFYVQQTWMLRKIKMELWVKTKKTDEKSFEIKVEDEDTKSEDVIPLYKNVTNSTFEFLGLFTLPRDEFLEEFKDNNERKKKKDKKATKINNSQFDYDEENDTNYQDIRFVTKNINLSREVNQYLSTMEISVSWTQKLAPPSSMRANASIRANLADFGLSVIDGTPKELLYVSCHEMDVLLKNSVEATTINFLLDNFQIDVQRYSARYCSLLAPEPVALVDRKAFVHIAVNLANIADADNLRVIQYFSLLIQKFQLNVEEKLLWDLFAFGAEFANTDNAKESYSVEYARSVILYDSDAYLELVPAPPTKFFFKGMIIQPLAIDFSLSVDSGSRPKSLGGSSAAMKLTKLVINTIINMVGNQDKVPLCLNALAVDDAYGDIQTLFVPIIQHYRNQGLAEAYKFIGGLDIIGNPVQLVGNLGSGVRDFFYEPINGITESPDAFVRGLGKGTGSLVSGVIGGVFGSVSKVTGTLGKIATDATFDEDAISERRIDQSRNQPQHVGDGLAKGGVSIFKGIWGGLSGIVTQPVKEIKKKGASGIGSGIGKGLVGLVMKPVAGVLDAATNITAGIANTPDALMQKTVIPVQRRRLPRSLQKNQPLASYKKKQALGSLIVWSLEQEGLDGRHIENLNAKDILDLREREKIMFQQIIDDGRKLVCGTNYRFFSVNILKTAYIKEKDRDMKELTQVHSIWKATFGVKNTQNPNHERDVTKKVRSAFKKTSTLHVLPIKQFQPFIKTRNFGDPIYGKAKVLKIIYTSTAITEKSALSSLFNDVVDTVTISKESSNMKDFDCLLSSRVVAQVESTDNTIIIHYYQYHTPSAITNLKAFNMIKVNLNAKTKQVKIKCANKNEAEKLYKKVSKYIQKIKPFIIKASAGYATKWNDCTKRMQEIADKRDLSRMRAGSDLLNALKVKTDENDEKLKYTKTLIVSYKSKLGKLRQRTKMFENQKDIVELD